MFPLSRMLEGLVRTGSLTVIDADGATHRYSGDTGPEAQIRIADRSLYWKLAFNPELAAGEAYMDGTLTCPDSNLRALMALFSVNYDAVSAQRHMRMIEAISYRMRRIRQANSLTRARANVAHHYDLGNDLYRLFLDREMFYSCAYFRNPSETLEQAQTNKCRLIAAKMRLAPGQRVLDIGSGWGGMARYLARVADVEVLGVTLSTEQLALARQWTEAEGLDDRVRFELRDYRTLTEKFDRIVSIGMFEHVGAPNYGAFFGKVRDLLEPDGLMVLHSIGKMNPPRAASPWLSKYIFPGAYGPALSEVFPATERTGLWVSDVEFLRLHYADTLAHWERRFQANRAAVADMYDERFCRMWEFYLTGTEAAFRYGAQQVFQMQLALKRDAAPLTRDYIIEEQARLRDLEIVRLAAE